MFKKIAFSGLMLSMLALPLLAQQTTTPTSEAPAAVTTTKRADRMQRYQATDPATRARRQTDRLAKELNLDQTTTQKMYALNLDRAQKAENIMKGSDSGKAKALRAANDEYTGKLKAILTPDQMAKMEQMKGRMRNRQGMNESDDKDMN